MNSLQAVFGIFVFVGLALLFSENRREIPWKKVVLGLGIGLFLVLVLTRLPGITDIFLWLSKGVGVIDGVTQRASAFIFGYLGGGETPFEMTKPQHSFIIAFRVLPLILVVTVLSNIFYFLRILPLLIQLFSKFMKKVFGLPSPLAFGASASIFFGTIESPLIVKPYLKHFSRSELFALMSCSMSTIAGSVMVLYASTLSAVLPNALGHLMIASLISVPLALSYSFILIPLKSSISQTSEDAQRQPYTGLFDAIVTGIQEGLSMVLQITATLLVFFALVYLINECLLLVPGELSLELLLGYIFRPVVWLIGVPWEETLTAGNLMGIKIILNEFVSYLALPGASKSMSEHSFLIMTYALCGFANFGSMGIIVGGLSAILPERKVEIGELAFKSLLVGNLATLTTGLFVGLVSL